MGYAENIATVFHDEPSDDAAITIFGSHKNFNNIQRVPSRIPVSTLCHKKKRDNITEQPTRDKDEECRFTQDVDVMYLKDIKKKIESSYSCNQHHCPKIKERMEYHQLKRHSSPSKNYSLRPREHNVNNQAETSTAMETRMVRKTSTKSGPDFPDLNSIYMNIEGIEYNATNYFNNVKGNTTNELNSIRNDNTFEGVKSNFNFKYDESDDSIALKRTETRDIIMPKRNIYRDSVQREVIEWFPDVPIYSRKGQSFDKDNLVNDLTDKITNLSGESNKKDYDQRIISTIDRTLNTIPMWYPGPKSDQYVFKNMLVNKLLHRIKYLNANIGYRLRKSNNKNEKCCITQAINDYTKGCDDKVEAEINNWMSFIKHNCGMQNPVNNKEIVKSVMKRVTPLLNKPINKSALKRAIIDVMSGFPLGKYLCKNVYLDKFVDDLANRLLNIKAKSDQYSISSNFQSVMHQTDRTFSLSCDNDIEHLIRCEISKCLANTKFISRFNVINGICDIIMDYVDSSVEECEIKNEIFHLLKNASNIPEFLALNIAQNIIQKVKCELALYNNMKHDRKTESILLPRRIPVYTLSEERCCSMNCPATSTPKENKKQTVVSKLNPEEIDYTAKVANLIRAWMDTLPEQFNAPDEKGFKQTIINDLAGEITDAAKLEQLVSLNEKEKLLKYLVCKWLHKLDVYNLEEVSPQINNLLMKIKDIPIPLLTRPQHGNRQAMANVQHLETEFGWKEPFLPKANDILEDEISIWINEHSSDVIDCDKSIRNTNIHKLAEILQDKLSHKYPEPDISNDIAQWLNNIVKPNQRNNITILTESLKKRLINLPQDLTLAANREKKVQQKPEYLKEIKNNCCQPAKIQMNNNDAINIDKTIQQFIAKFIEHNYDIDDPMARGAFSHLLKTKLQRLNPPTRKQVFDNFSNLETNKLFPRETLIKELEYIKDISDWLKNIPMQANYNTVGNIERIDFVNNLAINILEVEEQREADPNSMDYNIYMASIISQFIVQLPIIEKYKNDKDMLFITDQLVGKIKSHRNKIQKVNESIDVSDLHSQNVGEFIEEFIRIHGSEIADDEMKLEAWYVRLLKEVKKMAYDSKDTTQLSKAKVYDKLTNVLFPGDESVNEFDNELEYIKEISEWLKSLPLLPIDESDEQERIEMICELSEKITDRKIKKSNNPDDAEADKEFAEYIAKWISDLSLDESREVIATVVIQQLINRIARVKTRKEKSTLDLTQANGNVAMKGLNEQKINKSSKTLKSAKSKQIQNPANFIVDAIEKWSASLPIILDDENTVKSIKDDATKKLFQKVGELSIDPRTFNDDFLYQEILLDEVESILEKLPQNTELQNNKDNLKSQLVQSIVEAQVTIKENYASDIYKQKLEHIIEASFPHPVKVRQVDSPGFEIYKCHLANIFILENFDHGNDCIKLKYERNIKHQINKFYDTIQNRHFTLMNKDEIYNELYSALYKVPIPNKSAVIREVEEIKTRCEIEMWFEQLPLKETNEITELLERHKMLAALAKRIHEIEKSDIEKPNKINKEIMKWMLKLPLNHGDDENVEKFAKNLLEILKLSKGHRKCIDNDPSPKISKSKKSKGNINEKITMHDKSQSKGPINARNMLENQRGPAKPKKNAAEIMIEAVENWCNQLPVYATTSQEEENARSIKDNLSTKILIKISELSMNPNTLNDDFLFDDLFDEELSKLLSTVPTCCDFKESKETRKMQLRDVINSVKPLLREEKARYQYKQNLVKTVSKILRKPQEAAPDKEALFSNIQDEIVDNFLQYCYDSANSDARQVYKNKVHEAVVKFLANIDGKDDTLDPLMSRNQLICELEKIKIPSEHGLKEEVEEIRMKNEISELFDELSISDSNMQQQNIINQIKSNLAIKLNNIESNGYSAETENKMKQEISKSLKKLNKNVKQKIIDNFVDKLRNNEMVRRAPPKIDNSDMTCANSCKVSQVCGKKVITETRKSTSKVDDSANKSKSISENNTPNNKVCTDQCQNKQSTANNEKSKIKKDAKQSVTHVDKCECYPDRPHSPENITEESSETLANGKLTPQSDNDDFDSKDVDESKCICGGIRTGRRPCFVPMGWYCNDDMPACRIPAGFFYY